MSDKLQDKISRAEGMLSGLILKKPDLLYDYSINPDLLSDDAKFYIGVANNLLKKGIEVIDEASFYNFVEGDDFLLNVYKKTGGFSTVKELQQIADINNADGIFDEWQKWNLVKKYQDKGILDVQQLWDKIQAMTSTQLVDFIEYQINDIDINIVTDIEFETLDLTNKEVEDILAGKNMGINYGKYSHILNYLSMGLPKGDLTMFASYTNGGKSSFIMNNIVIPVIEKGTKVTIIANEQQSIVYKLLLQTYVLTERLNYWKLPRKKYKSGKWDEEDKAMVEKAREIIKNEYSPYVTFCKVYDYDMDKVSRIAKRQAKRGYEMIVYDTMKAGGELENVWKGLIEDSKKLFQICSKLDIAGIVSFQLAPSTKNHLRVLNESALANGKQVAEVFSEMFAFRDVWDDEFDGESCDIKPYRFKKDANGKYTNTKEPIILDKDKKYKIFFHFKTRNDEVGSAIVYEFQGYQNKWNEIGYCHVTDRNK